MDNERAGRDYGVAKSFRPSLEKAGIIQGSPTWDPIGRAIARLIFAPDLPLDGDVTGIIPPCLPCLVHHVEAAGAWIWYSKSKVGIFLRMVTTEPPAEAPIGPDRQLG